MDRLKSGAPRDLSATFRSGVGGTPALTSGRIQELGMSNANPLREQMIAAGLIRPRTSRPFVEVTATSSKASLRLDAAAVAAANRPHEEDFADGLDSESFHRRRTIAQGLEKLRRERGK